MIVAMVGTRTVYYAIGDIHGEFDRLIALHRTIDAYHAQYFRDRSAIRIHLGDYVDRGPDSAKVIDWLMAAQEERPDHMICLKGNHEAIMVEAFEGETDRWLRQGGLQTLDSYARQGHDRPPERHLIWMKACPTRFHVPDRKLVFVHASIDPDIFPEPDERLQLWGRRPAFFESSSWDNPDLDGYRVVHGHTPTPDNQPEISSDGRRINIDTGACYGGVLTAVVLGHDAETISFLKA